ncbi:tRNA preQ1(34) S-adenosylmethionine ribosyltransferase-isomerase QueA [Hyphococcus sp.]|uniref:tRNA preQ1(34) S-adenosylmethionine ribosyltransferase-isomerase QueA n=1 Tax=Hyphococcus sp. TaxID=2038636 RepID=UPI003CCBC6E3
MRVDLFDFDLPPDRIALEPARPRDAARLLHVSPAGVEDRFVRGLPSLLQPGDLLVTNDTKVIPAQLFGERTARIDGGGNAAVSIEATLHKELGDHYWRAFVRPAKRLKTGDTVRFKSGLYARVTRREGAEADLKFEIADETFEAVLSRAGVMPLPPYIARKRPANETDSENYQTIFANALGSVAAPTAGLHFTPSLIEILSGKGVQHLSITLHVGAGTFLPVTAEETSEHKMHAEWGEITERQAAQINKTRRAGGRIVAVGTTSLRLIESAARDDGSVHPFSGETDIFITPGYRFKSVDMLMTNFHLPRSTLFMLVCAFTGVETMKAAYAHAINNQYRFYSYGDACLLERN